MLSFLLMHFIVSTGSGDQGSSILKLPKDALHIVGTYLSSDDSYVASTTCKAFNESMWRIPKIAKAHESQYIRCCAIGHGENYLQFLKGVLVYKPKPGSDVGKIELPIAKLANPLGGTFDLSQCGDSGQYLNIATGYRKQQLPANSNKLEVWLAPRFLIEKQLHTTAGHFKDIISSWPSGNIVGLFYTWGGWDALDRYEYLIRENAYELSSENLYEKRTQFTFGITSIDYYVVACRPPWEISCFYVNLN